MIDTIQDGQFASAGTVSCLSRIALSQASLSHPAQNIFAIAVLRQKVRAVKPIKLPVGGCAAHSRRARQILWSEGLSPEGGLQLQD